MTPKPFRGVIYVHTNIQTGKSYVGQTTQNPDRRFRKSSTSYVNYKSSTVFYRALQKYGWDSFTTTLLASATTQSDLNYLEEYFIQMFNSMAPNGYNSVLQTPDKVVFTDLVKSKISAANKGKTRDSSWNTTPIQVVDGQEVKHCKSCNTLVPLEQFFLITKRRGKVLAAPKRYHKCKSCCAAYNKIKFPYKRLSKEDLALKTAAKSINLSKAIKQAFKDNPNYRKSVSVQKSKPLLGISITDPTDIRVYSSALEAKKDGFDNTNLGRHIKRGTPYKGYKWVFIDQQDAKFYSTIKELSPNNSNIALLWNYNVPLKAKPLGKIVIWPHEWRFRPEQVLNFIKPKLGLGIKIGARKCVFKEIDWTTAKNFCESNHIQGSPAHSLLSLGVYYKDVLIGVATFSKHHRNANEIVLSRLCFTSDTIVVGALSKFSLLASFHFKQDIYTWVHKTLSDGTSYVQAGWAVIGHVDPDYFYIAADNITPISKQSRKKSIVNTPASITELEHATQDGLKRVYDLGKLKLVFKHKAQQI